MIQNNELNEKACNTVKLDKFLANLGVLWMLRVRQSMVQKVLYG